MFKEIDKKDQTWILLAVLHYDAPVKLQQIDPNEDSSEELSESGLLDGEAKDTNIIAAPVFDISGAMDAREYYFIDNAVLLSEVSG